MKWRRMVCAMKRHGSKLQVRNKKTGETVTIDGYWYSVENAYIVPLQCFCMDDYELVLSGTIEETKEEHD